MFLYNILLVIDSRSGMFGGAEDSFVPCTHSHVLWLQDIPLWFRQSTELTDSLSLRDFKNVQWPDGSGHRVNDPWVGSGHESKVQTWFHLCCGVRGSWVMWYWWCFCPALRTTFSYLKQTKMQDLEHNCSRDVAVKVTLLLKTFLTPIPWEIHVACVYLQYVYTWIGKCTWLVILTVYQNRLLKVTASHVHCKCGNMSETVPDGVIVITTESTNREWCISCLIEAIPVNFNVINPLQVFKCDSHTAVQYCAAVV